MASFLKFCTISLVSLLSIVTGTKSQLVPALYVFGDSLVDVGNNNYLNVTQKANFPNYGVDFPGGKPTGRFSNGLNGPDFAAQFLGFPLSPPPYLSITNVNQMLKGVNFGSAGSGILNTTGLGTLNMETQVKYFHNVTKALKEKLGKNQAENSIARSIFLFSTANNDIFDYFIKTGANNSASNQKFINHLANKFFDHLHSLYKLQARRFFIFGTAHLGCIPAMRALSPTGDCTAILNEMSVQFNQVLKKRVIELSSQLSGMKFSYVDAYKMLSAIFATPSAFGFKDVKTACCGAGRYNAEIGCSANTTYCADRSSLFNWDRYHPTEANSRMAIELTKFDRQIYTSPINLHQLATSA